ncbi:uncharacterized protein ACA1_099730 [Acanthamoeba castellanii str. Neff]|uniref:Uncharacterized protein n=1 Tax=Acanthamoeba castellanii (strain ATCC 30010 / Neff) TaxID=1257118 RepID=L8HK73_ACACF|nr:uncharacterized protein ACA1_099730 [Acanthamoeba castellanii str. Neff]ELR25585.1 hypothetical protein ACA1_099730 [Acanthamoeba castellanii str. Neff]
MSYRPSARLMFRASPFRAGGHGHGAHSLHAPPKPRMQLVEAEQVFDRPFLNILGVSAGAAFVFYHLIAIPFFDKPAAQKLVQNKH